MTYYGGYFPHADAVARIVGIYLAFAVLVAAVLLLASAAALVRGRGVRVDGSPSRRGHRALSRSRGARVIFSAAGVPRSPTQQAASRGSFAQSSAPRKSHPGSGSRSGRETVA